MKKVLFIALCLFGLNAFGQEVPAYLKDAQITVKLANGKTYEFSANEWMVVRRGAKASAPVEADTVAAVEVVEPKKNRIVIHAGVGHNGLARSSTSNSVTVKEKTVPVLGLSVGRLITDDVSVMGTVFTNETLTLGVGLDY